MAIGSLASSLVSYFGKTKKSIMGVSSNSVWHNRGLISEIKYKNLII